MKPHITVDDISDLQTLEGYFKRAKGDIRLRYKHALEAENGNVNRALKRLAFATACTILSTALNYTTEVQEKEERAVDLGKMAMQIVGTLPILSMIAYGIGSKLLTDELEVLEKEEDS